MASFVKELATQISGLDLSAAQAIINNNQNGVFMINPAIPPTVSFPATGTTSGQTVLISTLSTYQQNVYSCIIDCYNPIGGYITCRVLDPCTCSYICSEFYTIQSTLTIGPVILFCQYRRVD